jgi:threonine aldolase
MYEAEVGDDRYGEDPTVRELQELYASIVGKEAALFVPSGTMANQVALRTWTSPGDVVIAGKNQHILQYERSGSAVNSSVQINAVSDDRGVLNPSEVEREIELLEYLGHSLGLVSVENTHMPSGGRPYELEELKALRAVTGDTPVHMDGARLFNASVATGVDPKEYGACVDSVMSCVSKGLAAPVGSLLGGTADFIASARDQRQILGGQMRQAGIIAAAGVVALRSMRDRLEEDHRRAGRLADAVVEIFGESCIDRASVRTNVVVFHHDSPDTLISEMASNGILIGSIAPNVVRMVTHNDVSDDDIDRAIKTLRLCSE